MLVKLPLSKRHIVNVQEFTQADLEILFELTDSAKRGLLKDLLLAHRKIVCSLFYEPSTRTRFSFESAGIRLGCSIIGTENAAEFSSSIKGESLEDSIRVISKYCDAIVLRHKENDAAERAANVSSVPIINAGCGTGQHPTQAFLDWYTILSKLRHIEGREFALVGDLKHGRTVRSLAYLLGRYKGVKIHFVSLASLSVEQDIKDYLERHNVEYYEHPSLKKIIGQVDVVYMTRIQKERMPEGRDFVYMRNHEESLVLDLALASQMKKDSLIMHPLPRVEEITAEVDALPQAVYFEQAENGLYVRMALLYMLLN